MSCNNPIYSNVNGKLVPFPCRRCAGCRSERRQTLSMRMRFEISTMYKEGYGSSFGTLTYDEQHYRGICKKDVIDFNKRLRYYIRKEKPFGVSPDYKYFIVSELGDTTSRAHYHFIYFGIPSTWLNTYLRKSWKNGFVQVSCATTGRINYCLKYMDKQQFPYENLCKDKDSEHYAMYFDTLDRQWKEAPFTLMSKGIGARYLEEHKNEAMETGTINNGGRFVKYPDYYAKKFGLDMVYLQTLRFERLKELVKSCGSKLGLYTAEKAYKRELQLTHKMRMSGNPADDYGEKGAKAFLDSVSGDSVKNNVDLLRSIENEI